MWKTIALLREREKALGLFVLKMLFPAETSARGANEK